MEVSQPAARPGRLRLFSLEPKMRVLHLSWLAFFISFYVWLNHAPLMAAIRDSLGLSKAEVGALLTLNLAFTIPSRVAVGSLVDKFGPRLLYTLLLIICGGLCIAFAFSHSFAMMAITRFLLGSVGAGFVIGIRIVAEWFPAKETGYAQGIYAGLGNFGSAVAAITLPSLALWFGGPDGWRYAIATTGIISIVYGFIYYLTVSDTPKGATYFAPKKIGAMEVTSIGDFFFYCFMQVPIVLVLAMFAWKLGPSGLKLMSESSLGICMALLVAYYLYGLVDTIRINKGLFSTAVPQMQRYRFAQVASLDVSYLITFGSELAVVSILPLLMKDTFDLSLQTAGYLGASFGMTTFFARPLGGLLSDKFGRKLVLTTCLLGTAAGYAGMSFIGKPTGIVYAVAVTFVCSLFVNAGNGAVYAMLPMIKRRLTGQIAGMVGAFGNMGGVLFLTLYSTIDVHTFFLIAGCSALVAFLLNLLLIREPRGQIAEEMPDGTIAMIDVT